MFHSYYVYESDSFEVVEYEATPSGGIIVTEYHS